MQAISHFLKISFFFQNLENCKIPGWCGELDMCAKWQTLIIDHGWGQNAGFTSVEKICGDMEISKWGEKEQILWYCTCYCSRVSSFQIKARCLVRRNCPPISRFWQHGRTHHRENTIIDFLCETIHYMKRGLTLFSMGSTPTDLVPQPKNALHLKVGGKIW